MQALCPIIVIKTPGLVSRASALDRVDIVYVVPVFFDKDSML